MGFTERLLLNDTIAHNSSFAFQFDGSYAGILSGLENAIVYANNYGGTQYGGDSGWDPGSVPITYCDFQGLTSSGDHNIDTDPFFVDVYNGDFHLDNDPASPCIEAGHNSPDIPAILTEIDIDGQDRLQDSDDDDEAFVDMGADEVPDPNP